MDNVIIFIYDLLSILVSRKQILKMLYKYSNRCILKS